MRIPLGLIKGEFAGRFNFVVGGTMIILGIAIWILEQYQELPEDFIAGSLLSLLVFAPTLLYIFHRRTKGLQRLCNEIQIPVWRIVSEEIPIISLCIAGLLLWQWFFRNVRSGDVIFVLFFAALMDLGIHYIHRRT